MRPPTTLVAGVMAIGGLPLPPSAAVPPPADKSQYTLFNPTPRELMREMSTDRPDTTESPYTVDAGHLQLELSFAEYRHDWEGDDTRGWAVAPLNLKLGLLHNVDLQLLFDPYLIEDVEHAERVEGHGDFQTRLKINLWGNDGGDTALALMPFLKYPIGDDEVSNGKVEGGLIVPLGVSLPDDWSLGLMAEFDAVYDEEDDGYDLDFVHTATVSHAIAGELGGYLEYIGAVGTGVLTDYRALASAGLTYRLRPEVQLDGGVRLGLTDAAEDVALFSGISVRF
jgi:Putative MetA-pathway of phenol degradation